MQTTRVTGKRGQDLHVESGLSDLVLMKTAGSHSKGMFTTRSRPAGNQRSPLRYQPSRWLDVSFALAPVRFPSQVNSSISADNICVHQANPYATLYAMAEMRLAAAPQISEITLTMPNKHCLL